MPSYHCRILDPLLEAYPDLFQSKASAALALDELAHLMGDVAALILRENGERLFVNCLDDLRAEIERHAREAAGIKGSTCLN